MAKAQFHKNQKVWVDSVGAWATIEKIVPVWAKGFDEPVRITYEVGLGREFHGHELRAEEATEDALFDGDGGSWRILRARNKWQSDEDTASHPFPGTFPVVVTDKRDWGGWRVPGAEYDRDPGRFERQARLVAAAPKLLKLAKDLHDFVAENADDAPNELVNMARKAAGLIRHVSELPASGEENTQTSPTMAAE
ncbi:MAG TPA: hypothetical protein VFN88_12805 [Caulobacteraceae bacterium]|nr:hypothetical protein [Caulobacteraceae bacterium]